MKKVCAGMVFAVAMASLAGAAPLGVSVEARAAQSAPLTTTMKGVIKTIDDKSIVVVPSSNKKSEVSFDLTSSAKREGVLAAGDAVAITYYYENGKRVVTDLEGKAEAK